MANTRIFYCWVKLSRPVAKDKGEQALPGLEGLRAARTHMEAAGMSPVDMGSHAQIFFNGGVPPGALGMDDEVAMRNGGVPPGTPRGGIPVNVLNGGVPPGFRLGGFFSLASWGIDEQFSGDPSSQLAVEFAPVGGARADAVAWLEAHPTWLDESVETYFLMGFAAASPN